MSRDIQAVPLAFSYVFTWYHHFSSLHSHMPAYYQQKRFETSTKMVTILSMTFSNLIYLTKIIVFLALTPQSLSNIWFGSGSHWSVSENASYLTVKSMMWLRDSMKSHITKWPSVWQNEWIHRAHLPCVGEGTYIIHKHGIIKYSCITFIHIYKRCALEHGSGFKLKEGNWGSSWYEYVILTV